MHSISYIFVWLTESEMSGLVAGQKHDKMSGLVAGQKHDIMSGIVTGQRYMKGLWL